MPKDLENNKGSLFFFTRDLIQNINICFLIKIFDTKASQLCQTP